MLKKTFIFLQSGGLKEIFGYGLIRLKKIFYYKSETIFFYLDRKHYNQPSKKSDIVFKIINNSADLQKIDFDRIKTLSFSKWFEKGSYAILGFSSSTPVSFTWTHFQHHRLVDSVEINLSDNKCWTGPSFVDKSMRGMGINQVQKYFQIKNCPNSIQYFVTSANANNIASIKSLENIGFMRGLKLIHYYGVFSSKEDEIIYEDNCESIFQFQ